MSRLVHPTFALSLFAYIMTASLAISNLIPPPARAASTSTSAALLAALTFAGLPSPACCHLRSKVNPCSRFHASSREAATYL